MNIAGKISTILITSLLAVSIMAFFIQCLLDIRSMSSRKGLARVCFDTRCFILVSLMSGAVFLLGLSIAGSLVIDIVGKVNVPSWLLMLCSR